METEDKACVPISCVPEDGCLVRVTRLDENNQPTGDTVGVPAVFHMQESATAVGKASESFAELSEDIKTELMDHKGAGPTLRSQMKQKQREFSKGGRWIVGKRGEAVPLTEKQFIATSDRVSARRRERGGNTRFTPKADK